MTNDAIMPIRYVSDCSNRNCDRKYNIIYLTFNNKLYANSELELMYHRPDIIEDIQKKNKKIEDFNGLDILAAHGI